MAPIPQQDADSSRRRSPIGLPPGVSAVSTQGRGGEPANAASDPSPARARPPLLTSAGWTKSRKHRKLTNTVTVKNLLKPNE